MVKRYFLQYGAQNVAVDELGQRIASLLGMQTQQRDTLYAGGYIKCSGPTADYLTIESDKEGDGTPKHETEPLSSYQVFVDVSNIHGKNIDKEARNAAIKHAFSTIPELVLLKETLLEQER